MMPIFLSSAVQAGVGGQRVNRARNGLAIDGYDPVAYFVESKPVKGPAEFEYEWNGTRYRFASAANRDRFAQDPARYVPQYGGFCAFAVSRGHTADIDPEAWSIVNGRLYLNYSRRVQRTWQEDVPGNIKKADENWPRLMDK
jgi:YHS domain-containing protein